MTRCLEQLQKPTVVVLLLTATCFAVAQEPKILSDHTGWVGAVAFSSDSKLLATASADKRVMLWNVETGKRVATLSEDADVVSAVAFSPDGKSLATGSFDRTVKLWDLEKNEVRRTLNGHRGAVQSVAFAPDGGMLVSGGLDGTFQFWKVADGTNRATIRQHKTWVNALTYSRDGEMLVSGSSDGIVLLWDPTLSEEIKSFDVAKLGEVRSVAITADKKTVAAGVRYGTVKVWDVASGKETTLKGHTSDVWGVAFTPDGKTLISGDGDWNRPGEVKLWDVATSKELTTLKHSGEVLCVAVSADGKFLAAGSWDGKVRLWELSKVLPKAKGSE